MVKIQLTKARSSRDRYYLIKDGRGMGSLGEPEGHYSHEWCVVNGVDLGNGYQGYMAVDYFLSEAVSYVPAEAKEKVRKVLGLSS